MFESFVNTLFVGIYTMIGGLISAIMSPFVNAVLQLVPDAEARFLDINAFFMQAGTYVTCIYRWLLFTKPMFQILFVYFGVKFAIFMITSVISLIFRFKKLIFV